MTTNSAPGAVYLAASSQERTLREMASRILASTARRPIRIAATFAAAGGAMASASRTSDSIGRLFDGAEVRRFTVADENGTGKMAPDDAVAIVQKADLVFVGGGDPVLGARRLGRAGADQWLRDARARGTPCLGISAGAIMLCAWWAEWPDDPPPGAPHDGGELVPCAGVVPDLVVDCHAEDDDWNELYLVRAMLREKPSSQLAGASSRMAGASRAGGEAAPPFRFLGLPTSTGIVIGPDGLATEIGGAPVRL